MKYTLAVRLRRRSFTQRALVALGLVVILVITPCGFAASQGPTLARADTVPGGSISVRVPTRVATDQATLLLRNQYGRSISLPAFISDGERTAILPLATKFGKYSIELVERLGSGEVLRRQVASDTGYLNVTPASAPSVYGSLQEVSVARGGTYRIALTGDGFGTRANPPRLAINGQILLPCDKTTRARCAAIEVTEEGSLLRAIIRDESLAGPKRAMVRLANTTSNEVSLIFLRDEPKTIILSALIIAGTAMIPLIIAVLPSLRRKRSPGSASALVEQSIASYSLSRVQLWFWLLTFTFVLTYKAVVLSHIHGQFITPAISKGVMLLMAVSSAIALIAFVVQTRFGGKGAGDEAPSLTDVLKSGGVITPERLYFALWTLISIVAFVAQNTWRPVTNQAVMTTSYISIAGLALAGGSYLIGSAIRAPGPRVYTADICLSASTVVIYGAGFSPEALIAIDDEEVSVADHEASVRYEVPRVGHPSRRPAARVIRVLYSRLPSFAQPGKAATLTIRNPDGQYAIKTLNRCRHHPERRQSLIRPDR